MKLHSFSAEETTLVNCLPTVDQIGEICNPLRLGHIFLCIDFSKRRDPRPITLVMMSSK